MPAEGGAKPPEGPRRDVDPGLIPSRSGRIPRFLDTEEVTGSNPISPTSARRPPATCDPCAIRIAPPIQLRGITVSTITASVQTWLDKDANRLGRWITEPKASAAYAISDFGTGICKLAGRFHSDKISEVGQGRTRGSRSATGSGIAPGRTARWTS